MGDQGYMDAAAVPVPDAVNERGPFMHGEGCPDEPTGRLTDQCNCGQREAVNKLLAPDAGDDTLRERLAEALTEALTGLPPTAIYSTIKVVAEPVLDTLLPIIREHVAEAWDEGLQSGAEWIPSTASGIPIDPPINPYRRGGVDR